MRACVRACDKSLVTCWPFTIIIKNSSELLCMEVRIHNHLPMYCLSVHRLWQKRWRGQGNAGVHESQTTHIHSTIQTKAVTEDTIMIPLSTKWQATYCSCIALHLDSDGDCRVRLICLDGSHVFHCAITSTLHAHTSPPPTEWQKPSPWLPTS